MRVIVQDDDGATMYESDDKSAMGIAPALDEREKVVRALVDAGVTLALGMLRPIQSDG